MATIGAYTETMAKARAAQVSRWVHWEVGDAALLVAYSDVRRFVAEAKRAYQR